MWKKNFSVFVLGVFPLIAFGCTQGQIRNASRNATLTAIDTVLEKEVRNKIQKALIEDLQDPKVRQLAQEVAADVISSATDGVAHGLDGKLEPLFHTMTSLVIKEIRQQGGPLLKELAPEMEASVRKMVEIAVRDAGKYIRKSAKGDLAVATRMLLHTAVEATVESLAKTWEDNKDPFSEKMEQFLLGRLEPIFEKMIRKLSKEAMYGLSDGWKEGKLSEGLPSYDQTIHQVGVGLGLGIGEGLAASVAKDPMKPVLILVTGILGAISIANLLLVVVFWKKYQQASKSLALFVHQLTRFSVGHPQLPDLMQVVESAHQAANHDSWLQRFLKNRGLSSPKKENPTPEAKNKENQT